MGTNINNLIQKNVHTNVHRMVQLAVRATNCVGEEESIKSALRVLNLCEFSVEQTVKITNILREAPLGADAKAIDAMKERIFAVFSGKTFNNAKPQESSLASFNLPTEIIERILEKATEGEPAAAKARQIVDFSRVCKATHQISQSMRWQSVIQRGRDEEIASLIFWRSDALREDRRNPTTVRLKENTLKQIKEWYDHPNHAGYLKNLLDLGLGGSEMKTLPDEIKKFPVLQSIYLMDHHITTLYADNFSGLSNLKAIQLSKGPLKKIEPDAFKVIGHGVREATDD